MSLVDEMINLLSNMEESAVEVHEERCIAVRNRHANCLKCVEVCTSGALVCEEDELAVYPEKCIGCGTCATACPTSAIEVRSITDDELTRALKRSIKATAGHPVIACETLLDDYRETRGITHTPLMSYDAEAVVAVPCLGRIDESTIVAAAAYRCYDLTLAHGACEGCEHATGGELCKRVEESARSILAAFGNGMDAVDCEALPARIVLDKPVRSSGPQPEQRTSRREFLDSGKAAAASAAASVASDKAAKILGEDAVAKYDKVSAKTGTLSQTLPTRRARLYNYLRRLGDPVQEAVASRIIGTSVINTEKCTSCRMCTVFCPTGALFRVDEDGAWGVAHRPSACMQCRLCESLCPQQAIQVRDVVPARQFMGKEVVLYDMQKPTWEPNKPDSMYNKFHTVVGEDLNMCMF